MDNLENKPVVFVTLCFMCERNVTNTTYNAHQRWSTAGAVETTDGDDNLCDACNETYVLEYGQHLLHEYDPTVSVDENVRLASLDGCIRKPPPALRNHPNLGWADAGYVPHDLPFPSWFSNSRREYMSFLRIVCNPVWDKWFVAGSDNHDFCLFVHPRSFAREARDAVLTFLCVIVRLKMAAMRDVVRELIARPLLQSHMDPVWVHAYVCRTTIK